MDKAEEHFQKLVEEAKDDEKVIGFFLSGSRGKNRQTKYSDYDIEVIVEDKAADEYKKKYKKKVKPLFGFSIFSLSEFKKHAEMGSDLEWRRPGYAHIKAIIDKNNKIQKIIDEKSQIPKNKLKKYISGMLDLYINSLYRSLKCFRDGSIVGARFEAAHSIHPLMCAIYALDERMAPYYKYFEWELEKHPLKKFPMNGNEIIKITLKILETGDAETQRKLFKTVENTFRKNGYGEVFDAWGYDLMKALGLAT